MPLGNIFRRGSRKDTKNSNQKLLTQRDVRKEESIKSFDQKTKVEVNASNSLETVLPTDELNSCNSRYYEDSDKRALNSTLDVQQENYLKEKVDSVTACPDEENKCPVAIKEESVEVMVSLSENAKCELTENVTGTNTVEISDFERSSGSSNDEISTEIRHDTLNPLKDAEAKVYDADQNTSTPCSEQFLQTDMSELQSKSGTASLEQPECETKNSHLVETPSVPEKFETSKNVEEGQNSLNPLQCTTVSDSDLPPWEQNISHSDSENKQNEDMVTRNEMSKSEADLAAEKIVEELWMAVQETVESLLWKEKGDPSPVQGESVSLEKRIHESEETAVQEFSVEDINCTSTLEEDSQEEEEVPLDEECDRMVSEQIKPGDEITVSELEESEPSEERLQSVDPEIRNSSTLDKNERVPDDLSEYHLSESASVLSSVSEDIREESKTEGEFAKPLATPTGESLTSHAIDSVNTQEISPDNKSQNQDLDDIPPHDASVQGELLLEQSQESLTQEESRTVPRQEETPIESFEEPLSAGDSNPTFIDSEVFDGSVPQPIYPQKTDSQNWKVGYLQVKLPAKSRKGKLKPWQKRWIVIQLDEFTTDSKNKSLILSIYHSESGNSRKHSAVFWRSVSSKTAVVYRSVSRTHPYAFTIADDNEPVVNLAADSESASQEWIAAIRSILWPPNSMMQLEKVLNGNEFEISIIDNDFSYRAGLLGTYGYLTVTTRKLILCHPHSGHVIQEWYLNTVDKFQILPQQKEEDVSKVLVMHTSSDSSTGCGELKIFCNEAVEFLKSIASTIHKVLQYHSKSNNVCYRKELAELADWLTPQPSPTAARVAENEDYYKVPPRQVRSLLDIPNFIFNMPEKTVLVSETVSSENIVAKESPSAVLKPSTTCVSTFSQDSGISVAMPAEDFLNCSITSFTIGNRAISGHERYSSTSESSDDYSPPSSPGVKRIQKGEGEETIEA